MLVYEVNLEIAPEAAAEYRRWLEQHVREILALPGFLSAQIFRVLDAPIQSAQDPAVPPMSEHLSVHYLVRSEDELAAYLRDHAPRLRAEGQRLFAGRFSATRRIMAVEKTWP